MIFRQGFDDVLNALAGPDQPEREHDLPAFDTELVFVETGIHEGHVVDAMWDELDLLRLDAVHVDQKLDSPLGHHHQAVGEFCESLHDGPLVGVRFTENSVKGGHRGHAQFAQQGQDVTARRAAEDPELMLQAENINIVDVQKIRGPPIRCDLLLRNLEPHAFGVVVSILRVIDGHHEDLSLAVRSDECIGQVSSERSNPALTRQRVADACDAL